MNLPNRPGSVAFRLVHELQGLLDGIKSDGIIHDDEVARLERWLDENRPYSAARPFSEIAGYLERALSDRVLTHDETADLLFVAQKLTTVNPHFDAMRAGVQILMGMLAGIAADGMVKPVEIAHLQEWLETWGHLKGFWPFDECEAVVTAAIANRQLSPGARAIMDLAASFPIAGAPPVNGDSASLLVQGICSANPELIFEARSFVFTGNSARAQRAAMVDEVASRGGIHQENVRKNTNYLIVCDEGSPCWAFACFGRKVEQAVRHREAGLPIQIIHEADFWDALVA